MLIDDLKELQHRWGYLPAAELKAYSERTGTPLYQIEAVVSFFPHFRTTSPPHREIQICRDLACRMAGGSTLEHRLRSQAGPDTEIRTVSCLGQCDRAPAYLLDDEPVPADTSPPTDPAKALQFDPYTSCPDYQLLSDFRAGTVSPEHWISQLTEAGLKGMGGAGFPTGAKWKLVRQAPGTVKYLICNGDESEPGTFKDRHLLEVAPHLVLEGMVAGALTIGAAEAILYLRHEYTGPRRSFVTELERARKAGHLVGCPPVRVFDSPGGYICGEETALLEALEGRRAEPRNKPPFPGSQGLWGRPTLINNVETFALATAVLRRGAEWYRSVGTRGGVGPKMIGLSGDVKRPGVYEVPMGTTLREFISEFGGGVRDDREVLAVCPGGASSGFLPGSMLDTPLDFRALQEAGSMLGSGAVIVLAEGRCIVDAARSLAAFFRNESCGKCVPCRVGTEKLVRLLDGWQVQSPGTAPPVELIDELSAAMADASICGLGQIAPAPVLSLLKYWPETVREHFSLGRCPTGDCVRP